MVHNITTQDGSPSGDTPTEKSHEVIDDSVSIGAPGAEWNSEEYIDRNGKKRIRLTKR